MPSSQEVSIIAVINNRDGSKRNALRKGITTVNNCMSQVTAIGTLTNNSTNNNSSTTTTNNNNTGSEAVTKGNAVTVVTPPWEQDDDDSQDYLSEIEALTSKLNILSNVSKSYSSVYGSARNSETDSAPFHGFLPNPDHTRSHLQPMGTKSNPDNTRSHIQPMGTKSNPDNTRSHLQPKDARSNPDNTRSLLRKGRSTGQALFSCPSDTSSSIRTPRSTVIQPIVQKKNYVVKVDLAMTDVITMNCLISDVVANTESFRFHEESLSRNPYKRRNWEGRMQSIDV